jgi:hypothetical protein
MNWYYVEAGQQAGPVDEAQLPELIRTGRLGDKRGWLLIKMRDEFAGKPEDPEKTEPDSALTGRALEEISGEEK